jgi:hypothetical protein
MERSGGTTAVDGGGHHPRHLGVVGILLRALAGMLAVAALIGLGIVFFGASESVVRVLLTILVLGAAVLLAVPAALASPVAVRVGMGVAIAIDAVATWVIVWSDDVPMWLGRLTGMLFVLILVGAVSIVVLRMTTGTAARAVRRPAVFRVLPGAVLVGLAWAMILSDGEAVPGRVIAGVAIIYAASAGGALVLALMRNYEIVRR